MKNCSVCLVEKSQDEFPSRGRVCKSCKRIADKLYRESNRESRAASHKSWRNKNAELIKAKRKEYVPVQRAARINAKTQLIEMSGGRCQVCSYSKCFDALEFHHRDPSQKSFEISHRNVQGINDIVLAEVAKCILLCSNCHREFHAGLIKLPS